MQCPKCQHDNPDGVKFCSECGNKLQLICQSCQMSNPSGSKFCNECGQDLRSVFESPSEGYEEPRSYTPVDLAQKIVNGRKHVEGERKLVTVFFADVAGFTAMSEKNDPEDVRNIMDGCFEILMNHIHRYEGTITQFLGDGLMALFGAPLAHEDHARRACLAGLAVQQDLVGYAEKVKAEYGIDFKMRIGLNSGLVIVGSVGDDLRMDYTAVGDTVNLASRMETAARQGTVLISKNVYKLVKAYFRFESKVKLELKGKKETQVAYEIISSSDIDTRIAASASKGFTRFIGRKNSMKTLIGAFETINSGQGQVVAMIGDAGVGKSRLLIEFRNKLPLGELTYLEGQCFQYGGNIIYMPVLSIIKSYFEIEDGDSAKAIKTRLKNHIQLLDETLSNDIPALQYLLSLSVDDDSFSELDPKQKRERIFEAVRNLLTKESERNPLVIAVDDVHWIDKTSEDFLDFLIRSIPSTQILLLLIYRPEYSHQWGGKSYYTQIRLEQLGEASSIDLIKSMLEEGDVAPEIRQLILDKAAGNPLYVEEFTQSLIENGTIEKENSRYIMKSEPSGIQVPDTIQGIIAARMDRLQENLKHIMQVASVIGRGFAFRILQTITGQRDELKTSLLNLQGLEFIYQKQLYPELEYIFKHAMIQEVAYNSLLQKRRKEIHQDIGIALEEIYVDRLEEFYEMLAYHFSRAAHLEKAYEYSKLSGEKSAGNFIPLEALLFFNQAIDILGNMPESHNRDKEELKIRSMMLIPLMSLGYPENSLDIMEQGAKLSKELGNTKALGRFYQQIGIYHSFTGNPELSSKFGEDCIEMARIAGDIITLATAAVGLCITYHSSAQPEKIIALAPEVLSTIEKSNKIYDNFGLATNPYFWIKAYYSLSLNFTGKIEEAKRHYEEVLPISAEIKDPFIHGIIGSFYGSLLAETGDYEALRYIQIGIDCAEKGQMKPLLVLALSFKGCAHHHFGEMDKAKACLEDAAKIQQEIGNITFSYIMHFYLFQIYLEEKVWDKAKYCAERIEVLSQENKEVFGKGLSKIVSGKMLGIEQPSNLEVPVNMILDGVEILKQHNQKNVYPLGYLYLGELYSIGGQKAEAAKYLKMAESLYLELGFVYWLDSTREVLSRL